MTEDFEALLRIYKVDLEALRPRYEDIHDQIPFPEKVKATTGRSIVHGLGLFTTQRVLCGETIAPARIEGRRTPAGRYTNHCDSPNAHMVRREGVIDLVACQDIDAGMEVLVDYREAYSVGRNE